ncbi:MAG TPA: PPC domain-containing protein [Croceibacterium sp.]|nr:PPC domain-containing protein [Croceibacterium sp.]
MARSINRWTPAALALALAAGAPAAAQDKVLEAGGFVDGAVTGSEAPASLSLRVRAGQSVQLDALPAPRSPDGLDLLMKVYGPDGDLIADDDDGGGALNPRLTVTSEAGGLYRVEVGVIGEGGPFTLLARETVVVPEVVSELALAGGRAERRVAFPADDNALFAFSGRRGEVYAITLVGEDGDAEERSDPMLEVFKGSGTAGESLYQDDDGGGDLNARVVAELPDDGTYTVRVSSLSSTGNARLAVAKMTLRPASVGTLAYDAPATVSFAADSPFVVDGSDRRLSPYALFRLPASPAAAAIAARGEVIVLSAESEGLDPWLEVGIETPFGFTPVLSNDDADGLNARLEIDPSLFEGADAAEWWDKLRVRVTAPPSSVGEVRVTAVRSTD